MCQREEYDTVAREDVVAAEHCSLGHISAPRWNFSLCLHNSGRGHLGWHLLVCETLMGTLLWGTIVPCHNICHLELKGTFPLLCGNHLVAEIRILVCKQSQVRKYRGFQ